MSEASQKLQEIVRVNSVNGNEEKVVAIIEQLLNDSGITTKRVEHSTNRTNLIAEIGNRNGPVLAFDGHADVVAVGDETLWKYPPFSATIADGKMYGRGVTDMKAGLMAAVLAMIRVKESGREINGTIRLIVTVGEEVGLIGAHQLAKLGYADDIEALVVCEPTGENRKNVRSLPYFPKEFIREEGPVEQRFIFIAHKGEVTYKVHVKGKAAHSSMPELGINAIGSLVDFYQKQAAYFETLTETDAILGQMTPVVTMLEGGEQPNSVPERASLTVKIRTIPQKPNDEILANIQRLVDECNAQEKAEFTLEVVAKGTAVRTDPNKKIVQLAKEIAERHFVDNIPLIGISGGTDASEFVTANPKIDVIILGPGNASAHQTDEFVYVDTYETCIDIYEEIMTNYFN